MPLPGQNFNLFNFRQTVGDPARPVYFLVHIPEIGTNEVVTGLARNTSLPGYQLGEVAVPFQGVPIKLAGTPTFADWKVTFMCDEAHELRRLFLKWQSLAYDVGTGLTGHSNSYKSDKMSVSQLARNGQIVSTYGFVGAWPKNVAEISVGHEKGTEFELFDVDFAYDYFVNVAKDGEQTNVGSFVRDTRSVKIDRGTPPPAGSWKTPFKPQ
jgi:hypothetical protein